MRSRSAHTDTAIYVQTHNVNQSQYSYYFLLAEPITEPLTNRLDVENGHYGQNKRTLFECKRRFLCGVR
jgi:hypothetical protein